MCADDVLDIFPVGDHGSGSPEDAFLAMDDATLNDFFDVEQECDGEDDGEKFVHEENGAESTN